MAAGAAHFSGRAKGSKSPGRRQFAIDIEDIGLHHTLFRLPELASSDCVCVWWGGSICLKLRHTSKEKQKEKCHLSAATLFFTYENRFSPSLNSLPNIIWSESYADWLIWKTGSNTHQESWDPRKGCMELLTVFPNPVGRQELGQWGSGSETTSTRRITVHSDNSIQPMNF